MWGAYYLCEDCGWTAEDDAQLLQATRIARDEIPPFLLKDGENGRATQTPQAGR